ncbi:Rne/Rng family ribonuclease [Nitrosomonas sp. HPC101]|uniref:Rne/Rng family ribonuclease n=1 Tax=Nitrosomonas sp. HPC101 TaxID=1658667 RepID=UPI00136935C3|nr:ribonuclease E/G [Nitrosomonas sp. HPC101]MXS84505.1 Rne/Rng family ribonuclease [Nitrosomonas sp. HPC101]
MNSEILINVTPQETRVAIIEQGITQELHIERTSSRGIVGNIYNGRVSRVLPGMQSAFIDIGLERAAFLHVADIHGSGQTEHNKPIEQLLSEGSNILVQVVKDAIGIKGARLSTQISLAGRLLVYLPQESYIGVSQRIEDNNERESLRLKLQNILPPDSSGGYIIRTMAETAEEPELQTDIVYLHKLWQDIQKKAFTTSPPSLLYQDLDLSHRVLRDFVNADTYRVRVDSRETHQKLTTFAQEYMMSDMEKISHYTGERPLFDLYGVELEIEKSLAQRVDLKSGGYVIIDQTEALTTIDFIDMDREEHRTAVLAEFNKTLQKDRTKMTVNGFTALGLVEMTRKRTRESLAQILCETCPTCQGRGEIRTAQTICYEILRELLRESRQFNAKEFRILASQPVIDLFLDEESQSLAQLGDFIARPIGLQVGTSYTQEQYDVILI